MVFLICSKIAWFILQPAVLACIFAFVGIARMRRKQKLGLLYVSISIVILAIFSTGFLPRILVTTLEKRFATSQLPSHIDGIIVLAGGSHVGPTGEVRLSVPERLIQGIRIAQKHTEAKIIFAGRSAQQSSSLCEAKLMAQTAEKNNISAKRILTDCTSRNTHENAMEILRLLQNNPHKKDNSSWVLITSAFHMPRAIGSFRKLGMNPTPYSVSFSAESGKKTDFLPSLENYKNAKKAFKEWLGLLGYFLAGYTDTLFPG